MKTFKYMLALCMWAIATISMAQGVRVWKNGTFHEYSSTAVDSLTFFAKSTAPETPDDPDKPITVGDLTLTTLAADSLDITSALFKARVDGLDKLQAGSYSVVFFYSKDTNDPNANKGTRVNATVNNGVATFKATYLSMADTYYYRVAVLMFSGDIAYGEVRSYTVKDIVTPGTAVDMGCYTVASCNLGADSPEGTGNLYAWGETEIKSSYTQDNYAYYNKDLDMYLYLGESISGTKYDVATKELGGEWRMPTYLDNAYLNICCKKYEISYKGVRGRLFRNEETGNAVFFPQGRTWLADGFSWSKRWCSFFYPLGSFEDREDCYKGLPVRAIRGNVFGEGEFVDLGLTSGTLWARKNVGALHLLDVGNFFAWGEITGYNEGKKDFSLSTYKYYDYESKVWTKYCLEDDKTELDTSDDAATVCWGEEWQTPSKEQLEELLNECEFIHYYNSYYRGFIVVSKSNGKAIFLPYEGLRRGTELYTQKESSYNLYLWTRTLSITHTLTSSGLKDNYGDAFSLNSYMGPSISNVEDRYLGMPVRPVRKK